MIPTQDGVWYRGSIQIARGQWHRIFYTWNFIFQGRRTFPPQTFSYSRKTSADSIRSDPCWCIKTKNKKRKLTQTWEMSRSLLSNKNLTGSFLVRDLSLHYRPNDTHQRRKKKAIWEFQWSWCLKRVIIFLTFWWLIVELSINQVIGESFPFHYWVKSVTRHH